MKARMGSLEVFTDDRGQGFIARHRPHVLATGSVDDLIDELGDLANAGDITNEEHTILLRLLEMAHEAGE